MNDFNRPENAKLEKAKGDNAFEEAKILFDKEAEIFLKTAQNYLKECGV